jgi:hypothetical protein
MRRNTAVPSCVVVAAGCLLAACRGISPLSNKITPGEEPFVIVVGEGSDGETDLFAVSAGGGDAVRLTFTRDLESVPALHPSGGAVAFVRRAAGADPRTWLVVLNLVNAAEREVEIPAAVGQAGRLGWSHDGALLYVGGTTAAAVTPAPPAGLALDVVAAGDPRRAAADSSLGVLLGDPPVAEVVPCPGDSTSSTFCAVGALGTVQPLGAFVQGPFRWGADSLGYFDGERLMVRSLGEGRPRHVAWTRAPGHAREATYSGGRTVP